MNLIHTGSDYLLSAPVEVTSKAKAAERATSSLDINQRQLVNLNIATMKKVKIQLLIIKCVNRVVNLSHPVGLHYIITHL